VGAAFLESHPSSAQADVIGGTQAGDTSHYQGNDWLTLRLYNDQVEDPAVRPAGCAAA
jgi:hypothetical protein